MLSCLIAASEEVVRAGNKLTPSRIAATAARQCPVHVPVGHSRAGFLVLVWLFYMPTHWLQLMMSSSLMSHLLVTNQ
eukprot:6195061-Pleurochrysis_carterae.AAC.1